ncbi:MAG TPA: universal stress protein [Actinomycetota bacterium]|nr:universal stress protein [Actinomycetota bacterium]
MGRIVVGVDGSPESFGAVQWAAHEAALRGDRLVLVHAWHLPAALGLADAVGEAVDWSFVEGVARQTLDRSREWVTEPGVEVEQVLIQDPPVQALLEAARGAELLVVGTRGLGAVAGLVLGSVSKGVLHHAGCPVVVIPAQASREHAPAESSNAARAPATGRRAVGSREHSPLGPSPATEPVT